MTLHVGTSGWQYDDWRGRLYPDTVPRSRWLEHYAGRFAVVEVDSTFYRLPEPATVERWAARTPDDFVLALKASRYLTHVRRLRDPAEPVARLLDRACRLGPKLGPILLQLPPDLPVDLVALDATLGCFPPPVRVAVEVRHRSWHTDATAEVLAVHGAALCLTDGLAVDAPRWRTAPWGYVRFHGGRAAPPPCYGRAALATWAARLADLWEPVEDVFAFFNNDAAGCAPRDARRLARAATRVGLAPTRVPAARELPVGPAQ